MTSYRKSQSITQADKSIIGLKILHNAIKEINYPKGAKAIIELGAGHLNDLNRWARAEIKRVIAIDIDEESIKLGQKIYSDTLKKNAQLRISGKKVNKLPEVIYIRADINTQLDQVIKTIYKELGNNYKVDHIICNFAIHYFMESKETIDNLINFVNRFLEIKGSFRFTCIDGRILYDRFQKISEGKTSDLPKAGREEIKFFDLKPIIKLSKEPSVTSTKKNTIVYKKGSKDLFRIKRLYDEDEKMLNYGQKVSVFVTSIGKSHTEFLVNIEYLVNKIGSNYKLQTLELFSDYIRKFKENGQTIINMKKIKISEAEYQYSSLHTYVELTRVI